MNDNIYSGYKNEEKYRKNLVSILSSTKYENLKDVCFKLHYGFSYYDIIRLATAYKQGNEELNNKIEYILTDCNFHYECGELVNGNADKLITENRNNIEDSIISELKEIFKKEYFKEGDNSFIPANSSLLKEYDLNEIYFAIDKNILQKRECEGLAFELTAKIKSQLKMQELQEKNKYNIALYEKALNMTTKEFFDGFIIKDYKETNSFNQTFDYKVISHKDFPNIEIFKDGNIWCTYLEGEVSMLFSDEKSALAELKSYKRGRQNESMYEILSRVDEFIDINNSYDKPTEQSEDEDEPEM